MKSYSFNTAKRGFVVRHMKEIRRRGTLSAASSVLPSFIAGSNVRIRHRPGGRR